LTIYSANCLERNPKEQPPPLFIAMAGSIICDLPEGALVEIFSWLPPESLMRFKCVSKSWYALINSVIKNPEFVNKHLHNVNTISSSSTSSLVFCCVSFAYCRHPKMESLRQRLFKVVTVFHDHHNEWNSRNFVRERFRLPTLPSELNLAHAKRSHCNGIICLAQGETIVLCNPAIMEWRTLPKPCLDNNGFIPLGVVFGYDSRANDYKVVRFEHYRLLRDQVEYFKIGAEVYSLRSDSWKEVGIQLELDRFPHVGEEVFCKGVFYWFVWTHDIIVSFNMFDEVFHSIPLPDDLIVVTRKGHSAQLAVWNNSVALFLFKQEKAVTKSIQVWATDDCSGGVNGSCSWIKKLTITPPVDVAFPLAFLKNDELLMQAATKTFILYNIRSQMIRELSFMEVPRSSVDWDYSYVKSLLSVHGGTQPR
ncbi:hypothetical protein TorRG33x02_311400, partial [Trema orientale]